MTSFCSSPQRPSGPRRLVPGPPRASTQAAARRCRATAQDRIEHNSTTMHETHGAIPLLPVALVHHCGQARPCPAALSRARARPSYEAPPRSRPLPPEHAPPSFFPLPVSAGHPTEPRHHRVPAAPPHHAATALPEPQCARRCIPAASRRHSLLCFLAQLRPLSAPSFLAPSSQPQSHRCPRARHHLVPVLARAPASQPP